MQLKRKRLPHLDWVLVKALRRAMLVDRWMRFARGVRIAFRAVERRRETCYITVDIQKDVSILTAL